MRKMRIIGIFACLLLSLTLTACQWAPERTEEPAATEQNMTPTEAETAVEEAGPIVAQPVESSHSLSDADNNTFSQITIHGLKFSGNAAAEAIQSDLLQAEDDYLATLADEEGALYAVDSSMTFTHEISYSLFYQDDQLISVIRDDYANQALAAHPETERYAYNYDAATGKRLVIADVLGNDWQETAVSAIYQQINEAGELDNYYPDLEKLLLSKLTEDQWYADQDNVYIIYNPYQIAPYAAGILEFPLAR